MGKIVVASYPQWNRVRTADYSAFCLTVDNEYAGLPVDEHVYNHEGKPLFWKDFEPTDIPIYTPEEMRLFEIEFADLRSHYGIRWESSGRISYNVRGLDCCGTPTFSHYPIDGLVDYVTDFTDYEPLTVGMVVKWFGWFLYQLENSNLQIGR
jgi:hypothetical protein